MSSGVKFALYTLAAILFIGGLNSLVNGEKATEFILWLIPFLCLGTGIAIPVLLLLYDTYLSHAALDSNTDTTDISNTETSDNIKSEALTLNHQED